MKKQSLYVFSSSRAMHRFLQKCEGAFLPKCALLGEFFSQSLLVKGKQKVPSFLKKIILIEVLKEFELNFKERQVMMFEQNFLAFLESSAFLFGFFDELHQHQISIDLIPKYDIYGDYEDHLRVLSRIYEAYEAKLASQNFYDFPKEYEIFQSYLQHFGEIEIFLDGFLSHFERNILMKVSSLIPIKIHLSLDKYNQKHFMFLNEKLKPNHRYLLSYPNGEILQSQEENQIAKISLTPYKLRLSQSALIFQKIQEWLEEGIEPEKIAVILPQEDFRAYLQVLDRFRSLNYAMGMECQKEKFYSRLEEIERQTIYQREGMGSEKITRLRADVEANVEFISSGFSSFIDELLFGYTKMASCFDSYAYGELVHLFLQDLSSAMLYDNSGGKVRVIGVLESRGMEFERVVLVDFMQEYIPSVTHHDFFLNSFVREKLQMPTMQDKKDLQKHYYLQLLKHTKEVAIAYLEGEESSLLKENHLKVTQEDKIPVLFGQTCKMEYLDENDHGKITQKLSATSIRLFAECKKKFFYTYIKNLRGSQEEFSQSLGSLIHQKLFEAYRETKASLDVIQNRFYALIEQEISWEHNPLMTINLELEKIYFQKFFDTEKARESFEILALEESFEFCYGGVEILGRVDRIDCVGDEVWVIDYKTGRGEKGFVYQSAVYALYARQKYPLKEVRVFYYALKEGRMQEEEKLEECIQRLEEVLCEMRGEVEFEKVKTRSKCLECEYRLLCNR